MDAGGAPCRRIGAENPTFTRPRHRYNRLESRTISPLPRRTVYRVSPIEPHPQALGDAVVTGYFAQQQWPVDVWSLPGGAIELGETPAMAVVREVYEEKGLRVEPTDILAVLGGDTFCYTYPDGNQVEYIVSFLRCKLRTPCG